MALGRDDLGPLGPPWTSSKLMFAQQMPIPQVRPGRAHLGRYPGRRGSTPVLATNVIRADGVRLDP